MEEALNANASLMLHMLENLFQCTFEHHIRFDSNASKMMHEWSTVDHVFTNVMTTEYLHPYCTTGQTTSAKQIRIWLHCPTPRVAMHIKASDADDATLYVFWGAISTTASNNNNDSSNSSSSSTNTMVTEMECLLARWGFPEQPLLW